MDCNCSQCRKMKETYAENVKVNRERYEEKIKEDKEREGDFKRFLKQQDICVRNT
jgi:hypothetical protein